MCVCASELWSGTVSFLPGGNPRGSNGISVPGFVGLILGIPIEGKVSAAVLFCKSSSWLFRKR